MNGRLWPVWAAPAVLALLTTVGLVAALVGDGVWDMVSAVTLAIPLVVAGRFAVPRRKRGR